MKAQNKAEKILSHEQREKCLHHCSFLWDGERKCRVHERTRRSLSDSVFVQAVLNYLPVCLKDARGNFDISSLEPALESFWPTIGWRPFMKCIQTLVYEELSGKNCGKKVLIKSIVESVFLNAVDACFSLVLCLTLCSPVRLQGSKSISHPNPQRFLLLLRLYPALHASFLFFIFGLKISLV